ncbi:hypothetical protein ACLIJR_14270 [Hydrogenophaga sp. XSHU_21]
MNFAIEKIPEEKQSRIDSLIESRPRGTRSPGLSSRWAIHDRLNAALVLVGKAGGPYEGTPETQYFVLLWSEHEIRFSGEATCVGDLGRGELQEVTWTIRRITFPMDFDAPQQKVALNLVREALDCWGLYGSRLNIDAVVVNINASHSD